jgi:polysaccharide deacetylase family protein (PEP-CTERM system associated)
VSGDPISALTVDVEDYFQVTGFENVIPRDSWASFDSRVERNTDRLLAILADRGVAATFFVLGWTAERHPTLIRRIHAAGHEVGCHSYAHRLVYECTPTEFREDSRHAKTLLEDLTGERVIGYRAPSFSITQKSLWALQILTEEGFEYDSSIFPILRDRYGIPNAPRHPYRIHLGNGQPVLNGTGYVSMGPLPPDSTDSRDSKDSRDWIVEFPPSTIRYLGFNVPVGGGGYLRLFPPGLFHRAIERIVHRERRPAILYIHSWEFDPNQPRFRNGSWLSRFRHYVNLEETEEKVRLLLSRWRFSPLRDLLTRVSDMPIPSI